MQRLFSTFPDRWPGFGLLVMRLGLGTTLMYLGACNLLERTPAPTSVVQNLIAAAAGIFLLAGLWTPVTACLATVDQIWIALSLPSSQHSVDWIHILFSVFCAGVAMLGPGVWSIDAHLFGRRRLFRDRNRGRRPSS